MPQIDFTHLTWKERISWQTELASNWCAVIACAAIPTSLALVNIALALAAVCWLLSAGRPQRWIVLRHQPVAWLCAALFAWILIGVTYSTGTQAEIALHTQKYAKLLLAAALMGTLVDSEWRKRCMHAFFIGIAIVLLTQYGEIFWDLPWAATHNQGWTTHTAFGDYITQGIMVSFMLSVALWKTLDESHTVSRRLGWAAVTLLCVFSVTFFSYGRTGYILLALTSFAVVGMRFKGRALWLGALALVVAFVAIVSTSSSIRERIKRGHDEVVAGLQGDRQFNSLGGRMENYRQSLQLISEKPLIGWGTGSFHGQACRVASTPEMCKHATWHPHNQYFLFGVQGGLVAICLFLTLLAVAARQLWHAPPEQRAIGLLFLVIFATDSLFNSSLFSARENHFFTVMLAVVLAGQARIPRRRIVS
jgi:O-antigen ligase